MTIAEFGQSIQAKYPQYAGKDPTLVGNAMLTKYPQYKDRVNGQPSTPTTTPSPTTDNPQLQEVAGSTTGATGAFQAAQTLGIAKAGMGIATGARVAGGSINQTSADEYQMQKDQQAVITKLQQLRAQGVPRTDLKYQQLENYLKRISGDTAPTQAQIDPGTQLSNKEVLGSFGNVAMLATTPGMPTGGSTLVGKVAAGAAYGYGSDVSNAANNNQQSIFKPGLGTAVGGGLPIVTAVGGAILKRVTGLTTGAGKDVIQRAIDNPTEVNAAINQYAKTPEAKQQLVDTAKDSINQYLQSRGQQFAKTLSGLQIPSGEATSAISYIDKNGQKVFTKLTPEELAVARNEIANIPRAAEGLSQIHLDPLNSKLTQAATEVSRADFIAGHPQVAQVFEALPKQGIPKQAVMDSFNNAVQKFGGQVEDGALVFGDTALNGAEQKTVQEVFDTVKGWKDVTPQGMDTLRQRIGNEMANFKFAGNGRDSAILGAVKQDLTQLMKDKIPGYGDMLSTYGAQTQTAKDLAAELSLKSGNAKPATQLSQVMKLFKKDPVVLDNLTKIMGPTEANKFLNDVSGAILSSWIPQQGLVGKIAEGSAAGAGAGAALLHVPGAIPAAAAGAAIASPKIVGKAAVLAGKLKPAGPAIRKGAALVASKFNSK